MDLRVKVVLDFSVPDETDPDEFHDSFRDAMEDVVFDFHDENGNRTEEYSFDTVRDIDIEVLEDD